ncbi:hypothetical protein JKP88DRAFT_180485 [Tribonema minus]|uniref:Uncharacterized protein n=1 Tax=Tribonema minus TaxID=303371 RepID=A0A835Z2U1_9STRA|nr:hypothetical protein JKP88DRAFT_180485 [Tribonema minus]
MRTLAKLTPQDNVTLKDSKPLLSQELYVAGICVSHKGWVFVDDGCRERPPFYWHVISHQVSLEQPDKDCEYVKRWADGTPVYFNRGRCCRCCQTEAIRESGPLVFSADSRAVVSAYVLCRPCLAWLVARAGEKHPQALPQKDKRGPKVSTEAQRLRWSPEIGDLLVSSALFKEYSKCLFFHTFERYSRTSRAAEQDASAAIAHAEAVRCGEARRQQNRARAMRRRCVTDFGRGTGDYMCWREHDGSLVEYFGDIIGARATGVGYAEYQDGSWCEGPFLEGQPHTSKGHKAATWHWPNGRHYIGQMANGMMHGRGVKMWPDGRHYSGQFAQGKEHGEGVMSWPSGAVHTGRFRFGSRDGPGTYMDEAGKRNRGNFQDGHSDEYELQLQIEDDRKAVSLAPGDLIVPPLSELACTALARQIAALPSLHSALHVKRCLPAHLLSQVAAALSQTAQDMSPPLRLTVPQWAWQELPAWQLCAVRLTRCRLNSACAEVLAGMIAQAPSLLEVDVSWNLIRASGALALMDAAGASTSLTALGMAGCGLGPEGATAVADSICRNTVLQRLDLACNNLGAQGGVALANGIAHSSSLTSLNLRTNSLGAVGGEAIAQGMLANCGKLRHVVVADNKVGARVAVAISASMRGGAADAIAGFGGYTSLQKHSNGSPANTAPAD